MADQLPSGGEEEWGDELDREVQRSLCGLSATHARADTLSTVSTGSFHSAATRQEADNLSIQSREDSLSTASYYSSATLQGSSRSPSSLSFLSLGSRTSVGTLVTSTPTLGLGEEAATGQEDTASTTTTDPVEEYVRPGCLAGSAASATGSSGSLASEGEVSIAGRVNERVGRLLGYGGGGEVAGAAAMATITGYEVVAGERDKFTVYKLRISLAGSVPSAWFIHRRYSDFLALRATLLKEAQGNSPKIPFPPKRWVGSNLDPAFLGRRLAGLQVFLATVMEDAELRRSPALTAFLCLDQRPAGGVGGTTLETNRAVCDTLEETVRELREQLRKREQLEGELEVARNLAMAKDSQISHLEKENELLRQQKESLMTALSSGSSLNTSLLGRREKRLKGPGPRIESLEDFTAKFGLRPTEERSTEVSPVRRRRPREEEHHGERRKSSIQ